MKSAKIEIILQTFVVTMMVVMGYLVAPILFAELNSKAAGDIAGKLFALTAYSVIVVMVLLAATSCYQKKPLKYRWHWLLSLIIITVLLFGIDPWMERIKSIYPQGISQDSPDWQLFAGLHGVYQLGYLMVLFLTSYGIYKSYRMISCQSS